MADTLREKFELWALAHDKPYDRLTPWAACEAAYEAGYRMALHDAARDAEDDGSALGRVHAKSIRALAASLAAPKDANGR